MALPFPMGDDRLLADTVLRSEISLLTQDLANLEKYRSYYDGDQMLSYGSARFVAQFGADFEGFKDNWCATVVDAVQDKLELQGFDFGEDNEDLLSQIWEVFRRNDIDEQQIYGPGPQKTVPYTLEWGAGASAVGTLYVKSGGQRAESKFYVQNPDCSGF